MATTATVTCEDGQGVKGVLQSAPFSSVVSPGFWYTLTGKKIDQFKLDDEPRSIRAHYSNNMVAGMPCHLNLEYDAFEMENKVPAKCFLMNGILRNFNTLEEFKLCNKKELGRTTATALWENVKSGAALNDCSLLSQLLLTTFADLKKYNYYYWFMFPAITNPTPVTLIRPPTPLSDCLSHNQLVGLCDAYDRFCMEHTHTGYFLIINLVQEHSEMTSQPSLHPLSHWLQFHTSGIKMLLGFCDPSTLEKNPGWPLRNLLALAACHWVEGECANFTVVCFRDRSREGVRTVSHSLLLDVTVYNMSELTDCPSVVGWEKNDKQKAAARHVNLSSSMDPTCLAESAVDLNLKLMRWRILPTLDLDKISTTRCLLLGAGTLGCNVARTLLGWGVRTITLVDNSKVSYSNPVRQSLLEFEDCLNGGRFKAEAAAERLLKIFPGVKSSGHVFSIPMPGHSVSQAVLEEVRADVEKLESLIDDHDVIFLLMDSRESRWLPTLLSAVKHKLVLNAALGFDTYLVMRHGMKCSDSIGTEIPATRRKFNDPIPGQMLGCYFCNDVVAPGDSLSDRTLDQQCTVTRPGVSLMAAALAVELCVATLQHTKGGLCSAAPCADDDNILSYESEDSPLGLIPHQVRGFLSHYNTVLPACSAFEQCSACSNTVMSAYNKDGFDFLLKVFNEPSYLEDLTGLSELHAKANAEDIWALSSDEETP